jgi:hypothetical protein
MFSEKTFCHDYSTDWGGRRTLWTAGDVKLGHKRRSRENGKMASERRSISNGTETEPDEIKVGDLPDLFRKPRSGKC